MPNERVLFIGDTVLRDQPPYLAHSDLPAWIETLQLLLSPAFRDYIIISGRGGVVVGKDIKAQLFYMQEVKSQLDSLAEQKATPEATEALIPHLLSPLDYSPNLREVYAQRLRWGLNYYYARRYRSLNTVEDE